MPKAGRESPPPVMVALTRTGISPVSALDAEALAGFPINQLFDLVPRERKRSNVQNALYWSVLGKIVEATDLWPTKNHLHEVLVRNAGFLSPVLNPATGEYEEVRDSTSFDQMPQADFNAYVDRAFKILSDALDFDVLDLLPSREKKQ